MIWKSFPPDRFRAVARVGQKFSVARRDGLVQKLTLTRKPANSAAVLEGDDLLADVPGIYSVRAGTTDLVVVAFTDAFVTRHHFQHQWPWSLQAHVTHAPDTQLENYDRTGEKPRDWHDGERKYT